MNLNLLPLPQWSLSAALLISIVALLRWLLQKRRLLPTAIWPLFWWLVLARLLLPLCLPCPYSLQNLWTAEKTPAVFQNTNLIHLNSDNSADGHADNILYAPAASTEPELNANQNKETPIWLLIWLTGVGLNAAFFTLVYWRGKRRLQQTEALPPETQAFVQLWLREHQLRRPITVYQNSAINTPLTYGLLKPMILLPRDMPDSNADTPDMPNLHFILLHEWTHIRHFDAAGKLLAAAALCLHWFNPAVWLFFFLFSRDLELACDDSVIRRCGNSPANRRNYALALLSWAANQNAPSAFCNSFGLHKYWLKNNVIEERIVTIMKMKKVSLLSLAVACLLLCGTAVACATNPSANEPAQPQSNLLSANMLDNADYMDYNNMSDEELLRLSSEQSRRQWAVLLEPYTKFGLGWQFDDPDFDGNGLKMYYQGREVRGIYDESKNSWLTEHTGLSNFAADAVELYAVYTDGQLTGLRPATPEELAQWDEQRGQPMYKKIQPYEQFGLTYGEKGRLFYNGQPVRYFWDGYNVEEDGKNIGKALHFEYINQEGEIDLRTKRSVIQNADGSTNLFGELLGLEVYVEDNFAAMMNPAAQQVAYAIHNNPEEEWENEQTIAERLAQYEQFGLEYREVITSGGARHDIYFQGELVNAFIDNTRSSGFTVQSSSKPEQPQFVMTVYDERGQLIGLRLSTEEEANERLRRYSQSSSDSLRGNNTNGEPNLLQQ